MPSLCIPTKTKLANKAYGSKHPKNRSSRYKKGKIMAEKKDMPWEKELIEKFIFTIHKL